MARRMNTDEPIYRVKITRRSYVENPNYRVVYTANGAKTEGGERFVYSDTETYTDTYGPYEKKGPAKAHITKAQRDWKGDPDPGFVGGTVQEGIIHWENLPNE